MFGIAEGMNGNEVLKGSAFSYSSAPQRFES